MNDALLLVLLSASAVSAIGALLQLARIESTANRTLIYVFRASLGVFALAAMFRSFEGSYIWEIVIVPLGVVLFAQIALVIFREPDKARRPAAVLVLAVAAATLSERAFGCAGTGLHAKLLTEWSKGPVEILLVRLPLAIGALPVTDDYDPVIALQLAQASTLAYLSPCEMMDHVEQWKVAGLTVFPRGSPHPADSGRECGERTDRDQAVVLADERNVIVAFRGTDQFADFVTDLSFFPTALFEKEWTHGGFADALERQWPWLLATVQRVRDRNQAVWITGHSLGGALAVLAADRFGRSNIPIQGVYTFGQPRVGGEAFAGGMNAGGYYRFVMNGDRVPGLGTPRSVDSGNLRYIDTLGRIHAQPTFKVESVDGLCRLFGPIRSHSMIHYLSTLQLSLLQMTRRARGESLLRN